MANPNPYNINEKINAATTEFETIYKTYKANSSVHKSLDFSNINISNGSNTRKGFRRFHQTSIYVQQFGGMMSHGGTSTNNSFLVTANLPESFSYGIGSSWEAPLNFLNNKYMNLFSQFVASRTSVGEQLGLKSAVNRATTLLVWNGSNPLQMKLRIPVIDDGVTDSHTNLVEALEFLGSLVLPGKAGALGFLTPPPSPVAGTIRYGTEKQDAITFASTNARITVQLGGILLLDNVIIDSLDVSYPNTKAMVRHDYKKFGNVVGSGTGQEYLTPLLAEVTIGLKTVEALTKETYSRMLWLKPQSDQGKMNADMTNMLENAIALGKNAITDIGSAVTGIYNTGSAFGTSVSNYINSY